MTAKLELLGKYSISTYKLYILIFHFPIYTIYIF